MNAAESNLLQIQFAPPDANACSELAEQHRTGLPTSVLSALGKNFLAAFYRYASHSNLEQVIVGYRDGIPVAGALISHQPNSLNRRILFKTPLVWAVLCHLHLKTVRQAIFAPSTMQLDEATSDCSTTPAPELLALFCRADARGQGIGSALIKQLDRQLEAAGAARYFVRTFAEPDNAALRFYIRHGFITVGRFDAHGVRFLLLMKDLPPVAVAGLAQ